MNVLESFSLKGKVALVTGGAGPRGGYGAQISEALYEAGATVWIASRNREKLEEFASRYPGMKVIVLDLADEKSIRDCIAAIVAESGKLDILVNNAVLRVALKAWDTPTELFDESMHVNASGLFLITRLAAEDMCKRRSGSIINIASYMGMLGLDPANYRGTGTQTDSDILDRLHRRQRALSLRQPSGGRDRPPLGRVREAAPGARLQDGRRRLQHGDGGGHRHPARPLSAGAVHRH